MINHLINWGNFVVSRLELAVNFSGEQGKTIRSFQSSHLRHSNAAKTSLATTRMSKRFVRFALSFVADVPLILVEHHKLILMNFNDYKGLLTMCILGEHRCSMSARSMDVTIVSFAPTELYSIKITSVRFDDCFIILCAICA